MTAPTPGPGPVPRSIATAEHYTWGQGCDGWHLVRTTGASVIQERMPPGAHEARHWHARSHQFFYVLSGTLSIEVEGAQHRLEPGIGLQVPPGTAHLASNGSDGDVEFLVFSVPPSQGDRHLAEPAGTPAP
jgi:mannose-6-phosphate isomerase-like protein (cupin superfamily)